MKWVTRATAAQRYKVKAILGDGRRQRGLQAGIGWESIVENKDLVRWTGVTGKQ
jgi:hypothetical protein